MKKTERAASVLLMIIMIVASLGLLYASIFASSSGAHSTFGTILFDKETGIRFNKLTCEFEVFNDSGVSWIASNRYISVDGEIAQEGAANPGSDYALADGSKTYNIMCDIAYTGLGTLPTYNTDFDQTKITLSGTGVIDGRGFMLKDFKVKTLTLPVNQVNQGIGTALVAINNGTIRNLNISNVDFNDSSTGNYAALICGINVGTIDNCQSYGSSIDNTYTVSKFTGLYGIAAVSSGRITNSCNNANLINSAMDSFCAGITSVNDLGVLIDLENPRIFLLNNINNGDIQSCARAAGIAMDMMGIGFTVRGNTNNGDLYAPTSISGIVDGGANLKNLTAKGNVNNGNFSQEATNTYLYYYGIEGDNDVTVPERPPAYGIRYDGELNGGNGGFAIYNADGISWISSGISFDDTGEKDKGTATADNAYYEIVDEVATINYADRTDKFNGSFDTSAPSIGAGGTFDANNCMLVGFPIRRCATTWSGTYYSGMFYECKGTIKNLRMTFDDVLSEISGSRYIGGIVGLLSGGSLFSCYVTGTIEDSGEVTDYSSIGGFVGNAVNSAIFENCVAFDLTLGGSYFVGGASGVSSTVSIIGGSFSGRLYGRGSAGGCLGLSRGNILVSGSFFDIVLSASSRGVVAGDVWQGFNCSGLGGSVNNCRDESGNVISDLYGTDYGKILYWEDYNFM